MQQEFLTCDLGHSYMAYVPDISTYKNNSMKSADKL